MKNKAPKTKTRPAATPPVPEKPVIRENPVSESLFRKLFFGSLVVMLGVLWIAGYDSGFNSDEMDMNLYGKKNVAYYSSGFRDTSFMRLELEDGTEVARTLHYYGSGFEYLAYGLNKITGNADGYEYNTRHMLNQLFAILGILFTGLIARQVMNYRAAFISAWLLFLTPLFFGLSIFDTKDIPFLTGYVASLYFIIRFLETLPRPSWKVAAGLLCSLAFTLSIRVGGVLLLAYLFLFGIIYLLRSKELRAGLLPAIRDWGLKLFVSAGGALLVMVLTWPFALEAPLTNVMRAIRVAKDFPQRIPVIFEGEYTDSLRIPAHFIVKYMSLTIPVVILVLLLASLIYFMLSFRQFRWSILALLLFASVFPVFYAAYSEMPVYNGWRHLLFVYPGLVIITGCGLNAGLDLLKRPYLQWTLAGLCLLGLVRPAAWIIKNNQYAYMYYNELAGGFSSVYSEYETDYWQISVKEAVDWLVANEPLAGKEDSVTLGTNAFSFVHYYLSRRYPDLKIRVVRSGYRKRFMVNWEYGIYNVLFLTPSAIEHDFPPAAAISTVDVDGLPVCAVVKDTSRFDFKALMAFNQSDFHLADSLFTRYLAGIRFDLSGPGYLEGICSVIGFTKLTMNDYASAMAFSLKALSFEPEDYFANLTAGIVQYSRGNIPEAKGYLETAARVNNQDIYARQYLDKINGK